MKKKFLKLVEKEGFILLLFLCVCVVAGGTIFLSTRNLNTAKKDLVDKDLVIIEDQEVIQPLVDVVGEVVDEIVSEEETEETEEIVEVQEEEEEEVEETEVDELVVLAIAEDGYVEGEEKELEFIEPEEDDVQTTKVVEKSRKIILPIEGPIITEYTEDSLIYSKTLEAWVGHKSIDIGAKEGTEVKAAMDGVIKEVYEDELWGIVIVIDHGDELYTKYSNLSTKEMVKVGVSVKQGDHISKVGKTAKIQMLMEPHINFAMINNGKIIDPRSINK